MWCTKLNITGHKRNNNLTCNQRERMSEHKDTSKANIQKVATGAQGREHMRHTYPVQQVQNPDWAILNPVLVTWFNSKDEENLYWTSRWKECHLRRKQIKFKSDFLMAMHKAKRQRKQHFQEIQENKGRIKDFMCCQCVGQVQRLKKNTVIHARPLRTLFS